MTATWEPFAEMCPNSPNSLVEHHQCCTNRDLVAGRGTGTLPWAIGAVSSNATLASTLQTSVMMWRKFGYVSCRVTTGLNKRNQRTTEEGQTICNEEKSYSLQREPTTPKNPGRW